MLPFTHSWLPFLYLYGLGGLLFLAGIIITLRSGSLNLKWPQHKKWLVILIFGFIWYFAIHGLLNLAALDIIRPIMVLFWLTVLALALAVVMFILNSKIGREV